MFLIDYNQNSGKLSGISNILYCVRFIKELYTKREKKLGGGKKILWYCFDMFNVLSIQISH